MKYLYMWILSIAFVGCQIFSNEADPCPNPSSLYCNGNVFEECVTEEEEISHTPNVVEDVTYLVKTDCSEYGAVCLYDGCYYPDRLCTDDTTSVCVDTNIGYCDHNTLFCPGVTQDSVAKQDCEEETKVKFPRIAEPFFEDPSCDLDGEYCLETTSPPTAAICTYWPDTCDSAVDTQSRCNAAIKDDAVFTCQNGVWSYRDCSYPQICCEFSTGGGCAGTCPE